MELHRGKQTAVQALTVAGLLSWWFIRASVLLPALSLDVATRPVMRWRTAFRAVNWDAATQRAMRVFMAFGATCGVLSLIAVAVTTVVILSQPAKPYPRITVYSSGRNPGPILVEFGHR
ncbi:hypothetical protein CWO91_03750 [Bradyrhizobium genosp. SA-3]|nr:hypothetical protein CWO91_03750 [Bradyrhizobium genosp. SA-3]